MLDKLRPYLDRRVALMLGLGFSCGLPILLVGGTFATRLATADIDIKAIGLFSYLLLPYSLKFLWAPALDATDVPLLSRLVGRRRAWMLLAQMASALSLLAMAVTDPVATLPLLGVAAFLLAFSAATQDIVVDAWRIEAAAIERQGMMLAAYQFGYSVGRVAAGAGALYIAAAGGWQLSYVVMAGLMAIGIASSLLAPAPPEPTRERRDARSALSRSTIQHALSAPLADLYRRHGRSLVAVLALVAFYRLPDFISGVMANPFYIKLGYSLPEIATVSKLYGVWIGMVGAIAGGWSIARFGLFPTLVVGAIVGAASNLSFSWLAWGPNETWRLAVAISIDNISGAFAGTALMAYMSGLTSLGFAATQYALLSSLYALPGKLVSGLSGFAVAAYGFPVFFALTAAVGIPVLALCLAFGRAATPSSAAAPSSALDGELAPPRPA